MKLLLYLCYDGSHFCGYQAQKNANTVQQTLNGATKALFGHDCDITGCSRTDSGVHAKMFCATVTDKNAPNLTTTIPVDKIPRALNIHLPDSIAVWGATFVPCDFHPRYNVSSKTYEYRIWNAPYRSPFECGRSWHIPKMLDDDAIALMQTAAQGFVGKRDFSACMASGCTVEDRVRDVMWTEIRKEGDFVVFRVRADGFLYHMVRIMTGTLLDVAYGKIPPLSIPERLSSLDRHQMGRTAPPDGLYLHSVYYDDPNHAGYLGGEQK